MSFVLPQIVLQKDSGVVKGLRVLPSAEVGPSEDVTYTRTDEDEFPDHNKYKMKLI